MKVSERMITVEMVHTALNLVTFNNENAVESAEPVCSMAKLCGDSACQFPRYSRDGNPVGLVAHLLVQLGYPVEVLKELDREYETGELLHPGVKIARSRNAALSRIDKRGVQLLSFVQDLQKTGRSWGDIGVEAFRPRRTLRSLDSRRRPWLY